MSTYDFVHLVFHAFDGAIQGRTKLQKTVYFVGALTESLDGLGYRPYFYGPYSSEVAAAVNELCGLGFLRQTYASSGVVDPQGFEFARYDFTLTPEGRQIAQEKAGEYPDEWKRINNAAELLKSMPINDYVRLSIAAKMFYLLCEKGGASLSELVEMSPTFGWQVTGSQLSEAGNLLTLLGLARCDDAS